MSKTGLSLNRAAGHLVLLCCHNWSYVGHKMTLNSFQSFSGSFREFKKSENSPFCLPSAQELIRLSFPELQQVEQRAFLDCVRRVQKLQPQIPPIAFHGRPLQQLEQLARTKKGEHDGNIWVAGARHQVEWPQLFTGDLLAGIDKATTYLPSVSREEYIKSKLLVLSGPKIDPIGFNEREVLDLHWIDSHDDDAYLRNQGRSSIPGPYWFACVAERWLAPINPHNFAEVVAGAIPMHLSPYVRISRNELPDFESAQLVRSLSAMSLLMVVLDNLSAINRSSTHFSSCLVMEKLSAGSDSIAVSYPSGIIGESIRISENLYLNILERGYSIAAEHANL